LRLVSPFGKEYTQREKKAELDAYFDEAGLDAAGRVYSAGRPVFFEPR